MAGVSAASVRLLEVAAHIIVHILNEILPVKLRFIGVGSFAYKMVHWLHSPPVLPTLIHVEPEIRPRVRVRAHLKNELPTGGTA